MHEAIHGNLFRNRRWDRWVGFVTGFAALMPASAYGFVHLLHHRHTRTEQDPDEIKNLSTSKRLLSFYFYISVLIGVIFYSFRIPMVVISRAEPKQRRQAFTQRVLLMVGVVALVAAGYFFGFLGILIHCWFIPAMIVAQVIANVRFLSEHTMTESGHPLREHRTITSNRVVSFFNLHLNYHLEHHLFPAVPWYNRPKLHRLLLPEFRAAGAQICRSYRRFLWDACRLGIHGISTAPTIPA